MDSLSFNHTRTSLEIDYETAYSSVFSGDAAINVHGAREINSYTKEYQWNHKAELDSLLSLYNSYFPDSLGSPIGPIHYIKHKLYQPIKPKKDFKITLNRSVGRYYQLGRYGVPRGKPYHCWQETFINYPLAKADEISPISLPLKGNIPSLIKPSFFALHDISQAYYKFQVTSHSVDSIYLNLSNYGAAEFTPTGREKVKQEGGKITYALKGYPDENTILLHVKYKDLENSQARRVFLVTAVISGLITIFLAFIIIFIYRFISGMRNVRHNNALNKDV